jgi:hypothetical protein
LKSPQLASNSDGAGTAITLNGIAQGFAADAAMAVLRRAGVAHALIDAGEMNALGGKPDGAAFTVGIQHPRHADAFVSMAKLQNRCLATSGDYETRFSDDFVHHHLFDPHTGHSPTELASVSIVAPTAMAADALSTAVFVLGAERGMELVRRTPGHGCFARFEERPDHLHGRFSTQRLTPPRHHLLASASQCFCRVGMRGARHRVRLQPIQQLFPPERDDDEARRVIKCGGNKHPKAGVLLA